jgi:hypothetical protein
MLLTYLLDRAIYSFLVLSIRQYMGGNIYCSPLLSFCAALGIKPEPIGFNEPHLYTGTLAAIM